MADKRQKRERREGVRESADLLGRAAKHHWGETNKKGRKES